MRVNRRAGAGMAYRLLGRRYGYCFPVTPDLGRHHMVVRDYANVLPAIASVPIAGTKSSQVALAMAVDGCPGHTTVECGEPGCRWKWWWPPHEPGREAPRAERQPPGALLR